MKVFAGDKKYDFLVFFCARVVTRERASEREIEQRSRRARISSGVREDCVVWWVGVGYCGWRLYEH